MQTYPDKQILFMGQMVRAILDGRKGMTRRLPDPRHPEKPYCEVGQRLWVRESFLAVRATSQVCKIDEATYVCFRDGAQKFRDGGYFPWNLEKSPTWKDPQHRFRPGIHLPRWACRIELECTAIRREPLSAITLADALAEGFGQPGETEGTTATRAAFINSWRKLHGPAFSAPHDPLVWVISFVRVPCRA